MPGCLELLWFFHPRPRPHSHPPSLQDWSPCEKVVRAALLSSQPCQPLGYLVTRFSRLDRVQQAPRRAGLAWLLLMKAGISRFLFISSPAHSSLFPFPRFFFLPSFLGWLTLTCFFPCFWSSNSCLLVTGKVGCLGFRSHFRHSFVSLFAVIWH